MKIDKLIERLQEFKSQYGNVEVYNMATGYQIDMIDTTEDSQDENISIIII